MCKCRHVLICMHCRATMCSIYNMLPRGANCVFCVHNMLPCNCEHIVYITCMIHVPLIEQYRYPNRTMSGCYEAVLDIWVFGCSFVRTYVRPSVNTSVHQYAIFKLTTVLKGFNEIVLPVCHVSTSLPETVSM